MDMVIAAGKSRKNIEAFVMLPPDARKSIDVLIKSRTVVGIPESNEYIFARFSENTPMSGHTDLKEIISLCPGLKYPNRITSTSLRKYIATVSQVTSLSISCLFLYQNQPTSGRAGELAQQLRETFRLNGEILTPFNHKLPNVDRERTVTDRLRHSD